MPLRDTSTRPAARNLLMWCEMVGCEKLKAAVKSQMQTGCCARFSIPIICKRVGSASAFSTSTVRSTRPAESGMGGGEQTPFARSGTAKTFIDMSVADPLTNVYRYANLSHRSLSMEPANPQPGG